MLNISRLDVAARQRLEEELQAMPSDFAREAAKALLLETLEYGMPISAAQLAAPPGYERTPVSMAQFLDDPEYMGGMENLRPVVRQDLIDCFAGDYTEVVIAGGIGTGKSTWVSFAYSYMIYLLSCLADPAKYYGLIPGTTVYLVNQSINLDLAKKVLFGEIKARIRESPYFQKYYPPDKSVTGELHFPKNIKVLPLACQDTSALGLNVFGGCLDEVNFYPIVARSKKVRSVSEVYDAAERMYTAIARRLKSRFMAGFKVPGKIMMVSQTQYDEDFTERKILEARTNPLIFVRRRALWESKTEGWCGETFQIQVGGKLSRPRILTGNESQDELIDGEVVNVPIEFRPDFDRDIVGATRDIAGRPTSAAHPFISDIAKLRTCIDSGREHPFSGFETNLRDGVRLLAEKLAVQGEDGTWKPKFYPKALRYAHIDYSLTHDECGLAVGCGPEMKTVQRRDMNSGVMMDVSAPIIHMDLMLKIIPPKGGEIDLADVRGIIYSLRDLGFWVRQCTFDQYNSAEGQQEFRKHGIKSETLSVDTDMSPYLTAREALYEARLRVYEYLPFETEMAHLEIDRIRGKVDHPPGKDKGITDAVASVCEQVTQASGGQLGVLDYMREQQDEWDRKKKGSILQKPMTSDKTEKCPKCGSMAIQQMPGFRRCGQCGEQFGGTASKPGSPSRKDFTK